MERKIYICIEDSIGDENTIRTKIRKTFPNLTFPVNPIGPSRAEYLLKRKKDSIIRLGRNQEDTKYVVTWCAKDEVHTKLFRSQVLVFDFIKNKLEGVE